MLSAAFKKALSGRRQAVRVAKMSEVMTAEQGRAEYAQLAAGYRTKVEAELTQVCETAVALLRDVLLPKGETGEASVFYYKMAGDYFRYMSEVAVDAKRQALAEQATQYYNQGLVAAQVLSSTHPTRLGLALNYSVFLHEVTGATAEAIQTARAALELGAQELDSVTDERTKEEAILTLQLLRDNLTLWESPQ